MSSFLRRKNPSTAQRDWKGALEDALILFFITLFSHLLTYGYPPTAEAIYTSLITALLTFFIAIQRKFKIERL